MRRRVAGVAAVLIALAGCGPKEPSVATGTTRELPTVTVTVAPVETRRVQRAVEAVGTLQGFDEMAVAPKVSGRVIATYADLGDVVRPGAILFEIDPTDYRQEVERARRALDLELARLGLPELISKTQFRVEDVPAVRRARFELENARAELERLGRLGGISERELDAAQTRVRVAQASGDLAITEANAGLTAAWLRKDDLTAAELRLADCTVRAPYPSIGAAWAALLGTADTPVRYAVSRKLVSEGETVQSNPKSDAFQLVIDRALKLPLGVPERHVGEVRTGQVAEVRVDAYPDRVFRGVVERISPTVDPQSRAFYPVVILMNLDGQLKAGGFARGAILTRIDPSVRSVPPSALVTFAGVTKIFVIEGDKAKALEVQVGLREKDWIEVIADLPPGTKVATSGHSQLVDGSPVKIRE